MESPQVQPAPCPKCGGVRFLADSSKFGLRDNSALSALYCTACGYVEFYANPHKLEGLAQERASEASSRSV
jgi:ribosomal protein S27AE